MKQNDKAHKQERYPVLGTMPSYSFHYEMEWKDKAHKTGEVRDGVGGGGAKMRGGKEEKRIKDKRRGMGGEWL